MNGPRFIDTNILLYSISRDPTEASKRDIAVALLDAENIALSVQVLQEFYVQRHAPRGRTRLPMESRSDWCVPGSASRCRKSRYPS